MAAGTSSTSAAARRSRFCFTLPPAFGREKCAGGRSGNGGHYGTLADSGFRIAELVIDD